MFADFPDTPEGIALALFSLILSRASDPVGLSPEKMLKLFAECLHAAKGESEEAKTRH